MYKGGDGGQKSQNLPYILYGRPPYTLLRSPSVIDGESLAAAKQIAREKARCDYALMMGASASNARSIPEFAFDVSGLKMYLNETFTTLRKGVKLGDSHISPKCYKMDGD